MRDFRHTLSLLLTDKWSHSLHIVCYVLYKNHDYTLSYFFICECCSAWIILVVKSLRPDECVILLLIYIQGIWQTLLWSDLLSSHFLIQLSSLVKLGIDLMTHELPLMLLCLLFFNKVHETIAAWFCHFNHTAQAMLFNLYIIIQLCPQLFSTIWSLFGFGNNFCTLPLLNKACVILLCS